jgi:hypothetical protein
MNIISLTSHLGRFREAIFSVEGQCLEYSSVGNMLQYASSIQGVDYSAASIPGMYCSGIAELEREEESALAPFIVAQNIFLLSWMALESFADEVLSNNPSLGKIGSLCIWLLNHGQVVEMPIGYREAVQEWIAIECKFPDTYRRRKSLPKHVDETGEGIYRVYCFRNHIFHGGFLGYDPSDKRWGVYTSALNLGSRIVAFTIQMGLMVAFRDSEFMETFWNSAAFGDHDEVSIREGFGKLHLDYEL